MRRTVILSLVTIVLAAFCAVGISSAREKGGDTGESPSLRKGNFTGTLAEGSLTAEKLAGPMKGKTPKDVFELLEYGKAGVAVHTEQNSGGELWGVAKQRGTGKTK